MKVDDAYALLSEPLLGLPKQATGDFPSYLDDLLEQFERRMRDVSHRFGLPTQDHLRKIEFLRDAVRRALTLSLAGDDDAALRALGEGLECVRAELFLISERNARVMTGQTLYRFVRRRSSMDPSRRASAFHVPFEFARFAAAVRYSVKGHPSLYLGNSTYLCWLECDARNLEEWHAARFDLDFSRLQVLDLCASTELLKTVLEMAATQLPSLRVTPGMVTNSPTGDDWQGYLASALTIWPLLAATSTSAVHSDTANNAEYRIPQLAMKWVQHHDGVGGIRFFSTREQAIRSTQDISINYALPAKSTDTMHGHDPFLISVARCTVPISVGDFTKVPWQPPADEAAYDRAERNWRRVTLPEEHGGPYYYGSWFSNLEYELDRHETATIETV